MALKKNANQLFTDRDEPRKAFWTALRKLEEEPGSSQVIAYYGEGGIGKTWLLDELKRNIKKMNEEGCAPVFDDGFIFKGEYVPISFNLETTTDIIEILCQLRYALNHEKDELVFPLFDCAVKKYMELTGRSLALPSGGGSYSLLEKYESFLDTASVFIPGLGTLSTIYNYVKKGGSILSGALNKIEDKRLKELYKEYFEAISNSETAEDIVDNIAEFFKIDLNNSERDYCIVFLIDTFEVLTYSTGLNDQSWLTEELAKNTCNTIWVFAGRNRIYSQNNENEHLLGDLTREDSFDYLMNKADIKDNAIIERIYEISNGTPIFLDICVQNYRKEGNPSIEEYRNLNKELLLKRYIKYLSDNERLVIRMMSSMSHWTDEDFKYVFNTVHGNSFSQYNESYNKIIRSTMIEKDNEDRYFLHRAVQAGIYEDPDYPEEVKKATLTAIIELYKTRSAKNILPNYYFDRIIDIIRKQAFYESSFSEKETALLRDTILNYLVAHHFASKEKISALNIMFDENLSFLCQSELTKAHVLLTKWVMLDVLRKYSDPKYKETAFYPIYEKEYGKESQLAMIALRLLVKAKANNQEYREALLYAQELYERRKCVYGESAPSTIHALEHVAEMMLETKDYKGALENYKFVYEQFIEIDGKETRRTIKVLASISRVQLTLHNYQEALDNRKHICEFCRGKYGENNLTTIDAYHGLSEVYSAIGQYVTARDIYKETYDKALNLLGEGTPLIQRYMTDLAYACEKIGDYNEAAKIYAEDYREKAERLGKEHPHTINALCRIAHINCLKGNYQTAFKIYEKAYEITRDNFGEESQNAIDKLDDIAHLYYQMGNYNKALTVYEKILSFRKEQLGDSHQLTIATRISLADTLKQVESYKEAKEIYEAVYQHYKEQSEDLTPSSIRVISKIILCETKLGNYNNADRLIDEMNTSFNNLEVTEANIDEYFNLTFLWGKELYFNGEYETAFELICGLVRYAYEAKGETNPTLLQYMYLYGKLLRKRGENKDGLYALATAYLQSIIIYGKESTKINMFLKEMAKASDEDCICGDVNTQLAKLTDHYISLDWKDTAREFYQNFFLGLVSYNMGDEKKALEIFETVYAACIKAFGDNNELTKSSNIFIMRIRNNLK